MRAPLASPVLALALAGSVAGFPFPKGPRPSRPPAAIPGPAVHADARVGDWVSYTTAGPTPQTIKKTITAVRADGVTIREEREGKSAIEYSLSKDRAPAGPMAIDKKEGDPPPTVAVLGTGTETRTVGGKKYECAWRKTKVTVPPPKGQKADPVVIVRTRWTCEDVPLDGEVRTEIETAGITVRWELAGFGRGK